MTIYIAIKKNYVSANKCEVFKTTEDFYDFFDAIEQRTSNNYYEKIWFSQLWNEFESADELSQSFESQGLLDKCLKICPGPNSDNQQTIEGDLILYRNLDGLYTDEVITKEEVYDFIINSNGYEYVSFDNAQEMVVVMKRLQSNMRGSTWQSAIWNKLKKLQSEYVDALTLVVPEPSSLVKYREQLGLTQEGLGKLLGKSRATIENYESYESDENSENKVPYIIKSYLELLTVDKKAIQSAFENSFY